MKNYLNKRVAKMEYKTLRELGLEISSGAVEGAVNCVVAKRFDSGGMRWTKERTEALLQLRCIEVNDDWDLFISYVHDKRSRQANKTQNNFFVKLEEARPLPTYGINR